MYFACLFFAAVALAQYLGSVAPELDFDFLSGWLTNGEFPHLKSLSTPIANISKAISENGFARLLVQYYDFSIARYHILNDEVSSENKTVRLVEYVALPFGRHPDGWAKDGEPAKQGQAIVKWLDQNKGQQADPKLFIENAVSKATEGKAWVPRGDWAGQLIAVVSAGEVELSKNAAMDFEILPGDIVYTKDTPMVLSDFTSVDNATAYYPDSGKLTQDSVDLSKACETECHIYRTVPAGWVDKFVAYFDDY